MSQGTADTFLDGRLKEGFHDLPVHLGKRLPSASGTRREGIPGTSSGARLVLSLRPFSPPQEAGAEHPEHGLAMNPRPQAALRVVPPQQVLAGFLEALDGPPSMGQLHQPLERGLRRKLGEGGAPLPLLPSGRTLPQEPSQLLSRASYRAPRTKGHELLAQLPLGSLPPPPVFPLRRGRRWSAFSAWRVPRDGSASPSTEKSQGTATTSASPQGSTPSRNAGAFPESASARIA